MTSVRKRTKMAMLGSGHCLRIEGTLHEMDSEILWEILKFPNFEYYPASCAILEYDGLYHV